MFPEPTSNGKILLHHIKGEDEPQKYKRKKRVKLHNSWCLHTNERQTLDEKYEKLL